MKENAMTKQARKTKTSGAAKAVTVADYIIERLAAEGISHCFGVAGDYVFPICDAVDSSTKVKWIGCANELNASYAAAFNYPQFRVRLRGTSGDENLNRKNPL
jgi:Thiamine pyrophosphate enzyme, N-terminal TPP binding domain